MMKQIIDAHCHIYPEKIAGRAVEHVGAFYGERMAYDGSPETLLKEGADAGVGRFVVSSVATTPHQVPAIHRFLAGQARLHPGAVFCMGALHPESADQAADVEEALSLGMVGIKLHPDIQGFPIDDPGYYRIYALCEGRLPVCCHVGDKRFDFSNPNRVKRVLAAFPGLCFIGAHLGGWSLWDDAYLELAAYPNLIVDCSSSLAYISPEKGREVIRAYGADRVLFGTDYPMWPAGDELRRFRALGLTGEEEDGILHQNAERVFHLTSHTGIMNP